MKHPGKKRKRTFKKRAHAENVVHSILRKNPHAELVVYRTMDGYQFGHARRT